MKNKRPLFVVLLCLLLAGGVVLALIPCSPMPWQCSKLYWQYRGQEGIEASYVRDYPIDDTTLVDVTLLRATTDSAWVSLGSNTIPYCYLENEISSKLYGNNITQWIASRDDIRFTVVPTDTTSYNYVLLSAKAKAILVFHTENITQVSLIFNLMTSYLLHTKNTQNPLP